MERQVQNSARHVALALQKVFSVQLPNEVRYLQGPDTKKQILYELEESLPSAEKLIRQLYAPDRPYLSGGTLVSSRGISTECATVSWDQVPEILLILHKERLYMTPGEEANYREYREARRIGQREYARERENSYLASPQASLRKKAVEEYGEKACAALAKDPDEGVREYVAAATRDEQTQLRMVDDSSARVRVLLAQHGTDTVRHSLLDAGEKDKDVLSEISRNGDDRVQLHLVVNLTDDPMELQRYAGNFSDRVCAVLLEDENPHIAVCGIRTATAEQCRRIQSREGLNENEIFMISSREMELEEDQYTSQIGRFETDR